MKKRLISILICLYPFISGCGYSQTIQKASQQNPNPLSLIINVYQGPLDHLAGVRYGQCPMHPTCSEYALESIQKHGLLIGWMMTCDRLMRCGRDETAHSKKIMTRDGFKYADPVSQNDFWTNTIF